MFPNRPTGSLKRWAKPYPIYWAPMTRAKPHPLGYLYLWATNHYHLLH